MSCLELNKTGDVREGHGDDFYEEIHKISCIKGIQNRKRGGLGE